MEENYKICKLFLHAKGLGKFCLTEDKCPYDPNGELGYMKIIDQGKFGRSCSVNGKVPSELEEIAQE